MGIDKLDKSSTHSTVIRDVIEGGALDQTNSVFHMKSQTQAKSSGLVETVLSFSYNSSTEISSLMEECCDVGGYQPKFDTKITRKTKAISSLVAFAKACIRNGISD